MSVSGLSFKGNLSTNELYMDYIRRETYKIRFLHLTGKSQGTLSSFQQW